MPASDTWPKCQAKDAKMTTNEVLAEALCGPKPYATSAGPIVLPTPSRPPGEAATAPTTSPTARRVAAPTVAAGSPARTGVWLKRYIQECHCARQHKQDVRPSIRRVPWPN
jgi:hypothetical protein